MLISIIDSYMSKRYAYRDRTRPGKNSGDSLLTLTDVLGASRLAVTPGHGLEGACMKIQHPLISHATSRGAERPDRLPCASTAEGRSGRLNSWDIEVLYGGPGSKSRGVAADPHRYLGRNEPSTVTYPSGRGQLGPVSVAGETGDWRLPEMDYIFPTAIGNLLIGENSSPPGPEESRPGSGLLARDPGRHGLPDL